MSKSKRDRRKKKTEESKDYRLELMDGLTKYRYLSSFHLEDLISTDNDEAQKSSSIDPKIKSTITNLCRCIHTDSYSIFHPIAIP